MRNYIILNGKNSNEINGLLIQELPPISKPLIRTEVEEIDGRDGDIVTPLGYSAYDKEFTIGLYKDFDVNEVAAYFNSEGTVIFSNELDKYYYYQITAQIDFERLVRYRTATVTMHCQPFKYSATEQPITEDVSGTVSDEGTNLALENTAEAPFNTLDLKGNTEQDGTPTPDSPQAVQTVTGENTVKICGKNLLKLPSAGTNAGVTYSINSDGTFNVHGTNNSGHEILFSLYLDSSEFQSVNYTLGAREALPYGLGCRCEIYRGGTWKRFFVSVNYTRQTQTGTPDFTDANRVRVAITVANGATVNIDNVGIQLEKGSSPTTFEPYQEQSYEVNLGKNLFDKDNAGGLFEGYISGGKAWAASGYWSYYIPCKPNTTYTASRTIIGNGGRFAIATSQTVPGNNLGVAQLAQDNTATTLTITTNSSAKYIIVWFANVNDAGSESLADWAAVQQLEKGSQASSYAAYFTPIELCKIGTYQDYIWKDGDTWKVHKAIGEVVLDGSETWQKTNLAFQSDADATPNKGNVALDALSNYYVHHYYASGITTNIQNGEFGWNSGKFITIRNDNCADAAAFKTWLQNNQTSVYYVLLTPTDTEITNEALIEQLDDIYYHAHSYKGRTHITSSAATGNVPHIIAAEVGEDNESTITNAGNYLSKPKITVYGSGDISLYINDMHALQITLGDEGYITIDTAQMEAYKDTLDNLKNRLVIGGYSNAHLKPGANKVHFTGTVTKYIVENYSRWL